LSTEDSFGDAHEVAQWTGVINREPKELRQLADQHCEGDTIHIAVADRLGEELRDEPETQNTYQHAYQTRDHRHHAREGYRAHGVPTREREHDRKNYRRERRIRPQNQDATRTEERVREQGHDRGIQPIDSGNARSQGISDTDRHQHRSQHQTSHHIARKPGGLVFAEDLESR
jgi:hypothetical protein